MRSKIFIYLFIFTLMFTIFIYVNDKKILDAKDTQIDNLELKISKSDTLIQGLQHRNNELEYFSLSGNEEALTYFENMGINAAELERALEDEIIGRNRANEGNDLVPYEGIDGVMRINKVKVLNHKWIIADFTDGTYWGELFISYDINEDKNLKLNTERSFLYPVN